MSLTSLKSRLIDCLRGHPRIFDLVKQWSRWAGKTDALHVILREFAERKKEVFFLQIGANDGLGNDPLREFVLRNHWRGCLIEPLPGVYARLLSNYAHTSAKPGLQFINAAISSQPGEQAIYNIAEQHQHLLPFYARQIASFDRSHLLRHFPHVEGLQNMIEEITVPCLTPAQVLSTSALPRVDLLLLDVEGHEEPILKAFPFATTRPELLIFESAHLSPPSMSGLKSYLEGFGYACRTLGNDTVAQMCQASGPSAS